MLPSYVGLQVNPTEEVTGPACVADPYYPTPTGDPHFANVELLLHGDGADGGAVFTDSSANGLTPTVTGAIVTTTDSEAFATSSIRCYTGAANFLEIPHAFAADFEAFTIECFAQIVDFVGGTGYAEGRGEFFRLENSVGTMVVSMNGLINGGSTQIHICAPGSTVYTVATYGMASQLDRVHIAVVRDTSNVSALFINGRFASSGTITGAIAKLFIGNRNAGSGRTSGAKMEEIRFTRGVQRYFKGTLVAGQVAFAPPVAPHPDVYGNPGHTVLSLHGEAMADSSSNTKTVTAVGNAAVSTAQQKFGTSSYVFDSVDDCLNVANNQDFNFGTGDFTVEFWVYPINFTSFPYVLTFRDASNQGWYLALGDGSTMGWGRSGVINTYNTLGPITANRWTNVAVTRASGTTRMFKDGVQLGASFTDTANYSGVTQPLVVGADYYGAGNRLNGYMDEIRVTRGVARYTADFDVATLANCDSSDTVFPPVDAPPPAPSPAPPLPTPPRLGVSEVRYIETSLGSAISPAISLATLTGAFVGDVVSIGSPVPGCTLSLVGSPPTALQLSGTPTEAGSTRVTATYLDSSGVALGSSAHVVNVLDPAALFLVGTQAAFSGRVGQPADVTLCSPSVATNVAVTASFNMDVGGLVPVLEWTPGATSTGALKIVGTPTRAITGIETLVVTYRSGTRILGTSSHSVMCSRAYVPPPPAPAPSPPPPTPPAPAPAPTPAPVPAPPPGPPADTLLDDVLMLHRFDSGARSRFVSSTSPPPAALFEGLIGPALSGSAELDTGAVGSAAFLRGGPGITAPYQATWAAAPESACVQALARVDEDTGLWLPGPGERFCPIVSCISPSGQTVWSLGLGSFLQYRSPSEPSVRTVVAVFFRSKMSAGGYVAATARLNMQSSTPGPGNWAHICGQWYTNHTACWWGARAGLENLATAIPAINATVPAGSLIQVGGVVSGVRVDGKLAACLPLRGAVDELRFTGRLRYSVGATVSTMTDQIPATSLQLPWPNY